MAKVVKTVFTCDICGKSYFTEDEYKDCCSRCKRIEKVKKEREKWFATNPPKFMIGDIVKIEGEDAERFPNKYFQIEGVQECAYALHWEYYGRAGGHDIYGDYEACVPNYNRKLWVSEEDLSLTIPSCDFNSYVRDNIVRILNAFTQKDKE